MGSSTSRADAPFDVFEVTGAVLRMAFVGVRWLVRRPVLLGALLVVGGLYALVGWRPAVAVVVGAVVAVLVLWLAAPALFVRWVAGPWSRARLVRRYRRRWSKVVEMCGLTVGFAGERVLPRLVRVKASGPVVALTARLVVGQHVGMWQAACPQLAAAFGVRLARVYTVQPGVVRVDLVGGDALAVVVPMLPIDSPSNLDAVPVGIREDGEVWRLPLLGWHVFVGGVTNSGKSSVIWSLIAGIAPAIHSGRVSVWAVDPKGGIEFGFGEALFTRFGRGSTEAMVQLLEEAVRVMDARCDRLAGVARKLVPTVEEPLILVLVDELSTLTAYEQDVKLRNRAVAAMSALLARGRAAAVVVVAAAQDPRKEVISFRSLFPVRVAMRLDTAVQVDMVLGEGMHALGAAAEDIPAGLPGVGFAVVEGQREPMRVRAGYVSDDDIHALAQQYRAPATHVVAEDGAA